jgi:hypothetical protein
VVLNDAPHIEAKILHIRIGLQPVAAITRVALMAGSIPGSVVRVPSLRFYIVLVKLT